MIQKIREKIDFGTRRYVISMLFLLLISFLLHVSELAVNVSNGKNEFSFYALLQLFLNDVTFIYIATTYLYLIYLLIYYLSDFSARMLLALALLVMICVQIGLMQYYLISNMLLGADMWSYSWNDIKLTVAASVTISWWQILLFPTVLIACMQLHYYFQQHTFSFLTSIILLVLILSIGFANRHYNWIEIKDINDKNLVINKESYFIDKTKEFIKGRQVNSPYLQQELLASAGAYPLQIKQSTTDYLGPYINKKSTPPNIVFILVEGLGKTFVGPYADYEGCMPFLDSLSRQGLFWSNFISNAGRTFGVLPAILGSLPFGKSGFMEEPNMPYHTSLIKLLNQNGYSSSFYYGGAAKFDGMRNFLEKQEIGNIYDEDNFEDSYQKLPANSGGFTWGYGDKELFKNSFRFISKTKQPYFNIYLTVTTHEPFNIPNPSSYEQRLQYFMAKNGNSQVAQNKDAFRCLMYTDDAIRNFIEEYKKRSEYNNTIFLITGDHRMIPVKHKNEIDRYHVPLLIYSPLLKTHKLFKSMASHDDVPSTFTAYLKNAYKMQMPDSVHWLGSGLTFETHFTNNKHIPIMRNKGQIADYVFGKYFITDGALQDLSDNLIQTQNRDEELTKKGEKYIEQFKNINDYVCSNNKLYNYLFVPDTSIKEYTTTPTNEVIVEEEKKEAPKTTSPKKETTVENKTNSPKPKETNTPKAAIKPTPKVVEQNINTDDELKAAQAFVIKNPGNAQGYYNLGVQHLKLGNYSWAKANLEKSLALNYKLKEAYQALINMELQRGDREAARWYYYKAIGVFEKSEFENELIKIKGR